MGIAKNLAARLNGVLRSIWLLVACVSVYPGVALCLDEFADKKGTIDIAGGTAHIPVMKRAAKNIMEKYPNVKITIAGGGTGVGAQKVGEGLAQIGNTGRALKPEEVRKYGLESFPFAIDGVAAVVNQDNPVKALTTEQLQAIFSGKITNWEQVGGRRAPINLYVREDGSGTRDVFEEKALKGTTPISAANVLHSNGAMKTAIKKDKNAIGYVGVGYIDPSVKALVFDGVFPSQENTARGVYPVRRLLYMNTKGKPQGLVKAFIDYICSAEGREIIALSGYIPFERE